jgi:DNA-binding response OmpR family regulator
MAGETQKKILIVDDEPDILLVLGEFLSKEGFRVLTAKSGPQALDKIREFKVDLVLLDIAMPGMTGLETLAEMRKISKDTAVIIITAYKDAEKVVEAFRLGAFDCIFKPFDLKYLRKSVLAKLLI